jgi:hypothetical protein
VLSPLLKLLVVGSMKTRPVFLSPWPDGLPSALVSLEESFYCELSDLLLLICSDIVQMASYAPLFVNDNDRTLVSIYGLMLSLLLLFSYLFNTRVNCSWTKQLSGGTQMLSSSTHGNTTELLVTGCRRCSVSPAVLWFIQLHSVPATLVRWQHLQSRGRIQRTAS